MTGAERPLSRPLPPPRQPAAPQAPVDIEEDDPYGVAPMSKAPSPTQVARAPARLPAASAYTAAPPVRPAPRVAAAPEEPAQDYDEPLQLGAPPPSTGPIY